MPISEVTFLLDISPIGISVVHVIVCEVSVGSVDVDFVEVSISPLIILKYNQLLIIKQI